MLLIGAGAIGCRHLRNLATLGQQPLGIFDVVLKQAQKAAIESGACVHNTLEEALAAGYQAALICTPPSSRLEFVREAIRTGHQLFLEKPLAADIAAAQAIVTLVNQTATRCMVGYMLRFEPGLQCLRASISRGDVGALVAIRAEVGQYLPDWRPGTRYQDNYICRPGMGGIIADASHELDYVTWLAGDMETIYCAGGALGDLEVPTPTLAAITMKSANGALIEVHLDCIQHGYARHCKAIGTRGTLIWDHRDGVTLIRPGGDREQIWHRPEDWPNRMYLEEMRHFVAWLDGQDIKPAADAESAAVIVQIVHAALTSLETGRAMSALGTIFGKVGAGTQSLGARP